MLNASAFNVLTSRLGSAPVPNRSSEPEETDQIDVTSQDLLQARLRGIVDAVRKDLSRVRELESLLRHEDDRKSIENYKIVADRIQARLTFHRNEFDRLQQNATVTGAALGNELRTEIVSLQKNMDRFFDRLTTANESLAIAVRSDLSRSIDALESSLVRRLTEEMGAREKEVLQIVMANLNDHRSFDSGELEEVAASVNALFVFLKAQGEPRLPTALGPTVADAGEILDDPKLDIKHRLRIAIPIVPMLLTYG